ENSMTSDNALVQLGIKELKNILFEHSPQERIKVWQLINSYLSRCVTPPLQNLEIQEDRIDTSPDNQHHHHQNQSGSANSFMQKQFNTSLRKQPDKIDISPDHHHNHSQSGSTKSFLPTQFKKSLEKQDDKIDTSPEHHRHNRSSSASFKQLKSLEKREDKVVISPDNHRRSVPAIL
uniref:Uncharacterized protein n=1 Tax=Clytia hemisphaerica TaxID=252671 RepID=A0A7M5VDX1_9CNID